MDRLEDGAMLPFGIETSYGTGKLEATDPANGESFAGYYQGTYLGGGMAQGTVFNPALMQTSTVQMWQAPDAATATGVLRGNKGTVMHVELNIRPGLRPTGTGRGLDNKGRHYSVRF